MTVHNTKPNASALITQQLCSITPRKNRIVKSKNNTFAVKKMILKIRNTTLQVNKRSPYKRFHTFSTLKHLRKSIDTITPNLTKHRNEQARY